MSIDLSVFVENDFFRKVYCRLVEKGSDMIQVKEGTTGVFVTWPRNRFAVSYKIQASTDSSFSNIVEESVVSGQTHFIFGNLDKTKRHHIRVFACNEYSEKVIGEVIIGVPEAMPEISASVGALEDMNS
jgi:hypothetical protein